MQHKHTLKSIDRALDGLFSAILGMAEQVQKMVVEAGMALLSQDVDLARSVVACDLLVDQEFDNIRRQCLEILSRYSLVAGDLRQVMAIEHSAADLERAADHARSIAKRAISGFEGGMSDHAAALFTGLHAAVISAIENASDALLRKDADLAQRVIRVDRQIDAVHDNLFHLVVAATKQPTLSMPSEVHLLFAAKSLERIGDYATNIAEEAMFMSKGDALSATRPD